MNLNIRLLGDADLPIYLQLLAQLTKVEKHTHEESILQLKKIHENINHRIYVIVNDGIIIGCGTLLIEPKMIHGLKPLAHVEDVVIDKQYRKHNLGRTILEFLIEEAKKLDCYKITLGCGPHNVQFYQKIGFLNGNHQMVYYVNNIPKSKL